MNYPLKVTGFDLARIMHNHNQEVEMVALNHDEIVDELKKFGITADSELIDYCRDYTAYYSLRRTEEGADE